MRDLLKGSEFHYRECIKLQSFFSYIYANLSVPRSCLKE
jgi:hypothetical protein